MYRWGKSGLVAVVVVQSCPFFATTWTVARQAPLSMKFLQARILDQVAISFSRRSSWLRDRTRVSCIAGRFFTIWATRDVLGSHSLSKAKLGSDPGFASPEVWNVSLVPGKGTVLFCFFLCCISKTNSLQNPRKVKRQVWKKNEENSERKPHLTTLT